jgi:predicted TIM-barrel fold metal-dependent hydrolase
MFTVDSEFQTRRAPHPERGSRRSGEANSDMMIAFASIDPHKGKMGAREARKLIEDHGVKGFKFHPTVQGFFPNDRMAWPMYEVIAEPSLPAIFHSGHSGMGRACAAAAACVSSTPTRCTSTTWRRTFPTSQIIIAHPSWPWQDEALSVCLHKPNVYIDLSGWSPKYFPPQLVQYANTQLKTQDAVRLRLPADHARPLDEGLRGGRLQGFREAADPQAERHPPIET